MFIHNTIFAFPMKRVFLVRHAKSSWSDPGLTDFERPLNNRGYSDAEIIAKELKAKVGDIECIVSSTALRAMETTKILTSEKGINYDHLEYDDRLYHASADRILKTISKVSDEYESVAIVGHNPGMTYLGNDFANITIDNLPTTGVLAVEFDIEKWESVLKEKGRLLFFDYPKRHKTAKKI